MSTQPIYYRILRFLGTILDFEKTRPQAAQVYPMLCFRKNNILAD